MWRRGVSLSSMLSSSKSRLLNQVQVAYGFNACQVFSTHVLNPAEDGVSGARRKPFVTFVLGGPGSGKGTQCTRIVNTFGFTHLSVGDLLRKEIYSDSENGSMILDTIKEGKIVPSEVTVKLIKKAIEAGDNNRILVDGFPRSEENRIAYERVGGVEPDIVLFFDCPKEEMVKRVLNRNQGRIDDNIDTVKERLTVFEELNLPVIKYYSEKGILHKIDGTGTEDEIYERVLPIFAALR
ncbi:UMP-CMP kinase-like isoform X2 [Salvia splendens]|uniref:UMP-CMP kinase-like isoform X1 n=1 Tax=Salvia splendens TaxID=180675 RepID=UPI001C26E03D|nr:UMP-CMP kinase-like isoform X1 [Salvia splendens]XP_041992165.1 UMP-CMP kinase-like isoform X2 [Salvia splendens]